MNSVAVFVFSLLAFQGRCTDVVLKPLPGKVGNPIGFVFIQGAYVKPNLYIPICQAIQNRSSRPMFVGIPQFLDDLPEPIQFDEAVSNVLSELEKIGLPKDAPLFMGAHSAGGVVLAVSNANFTGRVKGQMLFGSYIPRMLRNKGSTKEHFDYPLPTLTVSGSLDGLTRVSRIAEEFYVQILRESANRGKPQGQVDAYLVKNFPVIVVEGMTHWQIASGTPTSRVAEYDLKPEISQSSAYTSVSELASAFMDIQLSDNTRPTLTLLSQAVNQTLGFVNPIVESMLMEGSYHFEDPCYCKNTICNSSLACTAGSKWTHFVSSPTMAGIEPDKSVVFTNIDSFHRVSTVMPTPPYVHEPFLLGECKLSDPECDLTMVTISQNIYEDEENPAKNDDGLVRTGAIEIRTKLVSRQKVLRNRGYSNATTPFNKTDGVNNCGNINEIAIQYALKNADEKTVARYKQYGEQLRIGKDIEHGDGPQWIWIPLNFTEVTTSGGDKYMLVRSNSMKTCASCLAPGYHYCKVLSPVWVMDWLYTDSLRWKRGIKHQ